MSDHDAPPGIDHDPLMMHPGTHGEQQDGGRLVARFTLPAEPGSAKQARDFTAGTLRRWGMPELCPDALVVISELVTNAVRHARPPEPAALNGRRPFEIILLGGPRRLLCAVTDPCERSPVLQEPGYGAENGRGLHVVASLSDSWGWLPLGTGGKAVWAALRRPVPVPEPAVGCCEGDTS